MDVTCNSRFCYIDAHQGARYAVAEAARSVACRGARPMALTDCLNYGNPEKKDVMWQIVSGIKGISEVSSKLNIPVIGGNVSLYNENEDPTGGIISFRDITELTGLKRCLSEDTNFHGVIGHTIFTTDKGLPFFNKGIVLF